jgi:phosphoribosyl 1,2-cyclic phosphate phosphodiesterase
VNDDLLLDCGPDIVAACAEQGISLRGLRYALVTHCHFDHFYPPNLEIRGERYRSEDRPPLLTLVAGSSSLALLGQLGYTDRDLRIRRAVILPGGEIELPPYRIRAIAARHAPNIGDAMNFLIDDGTAAMLYAVDTGLYPAATLAALRGAAVDLLVIEATNGVGGTSPNHLNHDNLDVQLDQLRRAGVVHDQTVIVASHFSHHNNPPHDPLARLLGRRGLQCAYDGLALEVVSHGPRCP